jgi:hypothetical protein
LVSTVPDPDPGPPPLTALRLVYTRAYQSLPAWVWELSPREQSDHVMRAVCISCRSIRYPSPGLDYMACDPEQYGAELCTLLALAAEAATPARLAAFIADLNADIAAQDPYDDFPARVYDPADRRGRRPGATKQTSEQLELF